MKNILALLILAIFGGVCFAGGQYTQGRAHVHTTQGKVTVERIQYVPIVKLPTRSRGKGLDMATLQGAIPMSALRGTK